MIPIGIPDRRNVHLRCTDGRITHVSDERIKEVLDNGGSDNVTVIIGRAVTPSGVSSRTGSL